MIICDENAYCSWFFVRITYTFEPKSLSRKLKSEYFLVIPK